jgi:phosphohistidine phosphatase
MKTILISRHAKSSWDNASLTDFERPLNHRGHKDAPEMAEKIQAAGFRPDVLISSPANRALTTAKYYAKTFGLPVAEVKKLYHGMPEDYLSVIQEQVDEDHTVMLFGHNPGITYIANLIEPGVTDNIPTAGVIIASCPAKSWAEVEWRNCRLEKIAVPKEISY